jgi:hypothetical protein
MPIWLLIVCVLTSNGPAAEIASGFESKAACETAAAKITEGLVSNHINQGSVTCNATYIGTFS